MLAVRRLVEKGNKVVLSAGDGDSYIQNVESKVKVPIKKKGGSFVIEAHFGKSVAWVLPGRHEDNMRSCCKTDGVDSGVE